MTSDNKNKIRKVTLEFCFFVLLCFFNGKLITSMPTMEIFKKGSNEKLFSLALILHHKELLLISHFEVADKA